ncbi:putative toxin-antitoxin system toxin component, PIN family [Anabaena sp. UHCC 0451]|uniref:putative toxin-antitoxin system toxin component, PIN family n=1 Tax=Anabaena sp. UHCC 0451 TaxID=2055235 RepID=UPI002B216F1F|nr:putative toxin-antitoxin system toxin component, PIN family [Anabaena sp. UHCC 0451]MEA5578328.1 putative toxin-antitoxin system toxin component, PIN family [Anabaena sp. UHCC 0451]
MIEQKIVIDTNCFVSRLLTPNSITAQAVRYAFDCHHILVSSETLAEIERVLSRKKFDNYVSLEERQKFILYLKNIAEMVDVVDHVQVCRDAKDDKFLSLAIAGNANLIITGDEDLLVLKFYQNIPILSPKDFLAQADKS